MEALKIALLGGGTVGSAFYNLVLERAEELSAFGVVPRFLGVLVRDPRKPRAIPQELLRAEPFDLLEADLVVEAMGGVEAPLGSSSPPSGPASPSSPPTRPSSPRPGSP